ncbi:oligoendopeptidase F [Salinispira pacifica]|uniref:Oligopeptidase F n=1 Tax=Salinispira pacifica TaxID=1307761 RepID=V5WJ49_9SPIO|nr:oligoendopeptidase F [Salinispira pacifica]AHC15862.1 Oligoendopeptidase F [Salinispira pacifica]
MSVNPTRARKDVPAHEKWNLNALFPDDAAWEQGFEDLKNQYTEIETYRGSLADAPENLRDCLNRMFELEKLGERLGYYAFLKMTEDQGDSASQSRQARFMQLESKVSASMSFMTPEIQEIPDSTMKEWLNRDDFTEYRIYLEKLLRFKPHVLSPAEEKLMAMQSESAQTASKTFSALLDVDMDFGTVKTPQGEKPLTNSTFGSFMQNPEREVRKEAYGKYYSHLDSHKNTLASLYTGSVNQDVYRSQARGYSSSLEYALFPDKVDPKVYHNLVETVNKNLPSLHAYYRLRKEKQGISDYSLIDTKVPLIADIKMEHSYDEAVAVIEKALQPLGDEYVSTLSKGLRGGSNGGWVDKYENKGKRSGAFSAGSFYGEPYILMNYKEDLLRDLFTLAHEGGHSMHSWYSSRNNPFPHYNYTIFEAEVASTFNEQLLFHHMMSSNDDPKLKAYLINKRIDDMIGTIFRQTMFAEFELRCHQMVENGEALTVQSLQDEYRKLLVNYFGEDVELPELSALEGLRIPHFYRAFYVYKYATGLSAAISLSQRVLNGGDTEREDYFKFLKSGGSRFPLESLAVAGVDMSSPEPIQNAMDLFDDLVKKLSAY